MEIIKNIRNLDKKFAWSFFGTLIGIIGLGYAIYIDNFKDKSPEIIFEVLSNTNILDLKEDISKLDILYDGENIKKNKENLRVLTIKVINDGNINLIESHYDNDNPFGIAIINGKVVEKPELLEASIDYLNKNLKMSFDTSSNVFFGKFQFDKSQYFIFKILTICKEGNIPQVVPFGKISGITKNFQVRIKTQTTNEEKSFWRKLIYGSFWVHFVRFWFYLIVLIIFTFSLVIPISSIEESISTKKRKKKVKKFKENYRQELTPSTEFIFDIYLNHDEEFIFTIQNIISNPETFHGILKYKNYEIESRKLYRTLESEEHLNISTREGDGLIWIRQIHSSLESMEKKGIIKQENEKIIIDEDFNKTLSEFIYFLKIQ